MRIVKQRYNNDCAVASLAMALRQPYPKVLAVAKAQGFRPGTKHGLGYTALTKLAAALGFKFKCRVAKRAYPAMWRHSPVIWPIRGPIIVTVPSINRRGALHAVVYHNGKLFDPSRQKQYTKNRMMVKHRLVYFNFSKLTKVQKIAYSIKYKKWDE